MRVLDLFSGIGGIALGLERAGMTTIAFCEADPFCREWLAQQWPEVPQHDDVRSLDAAAFRGRVDIVAGGFPCQDVSVAGKGAGLDGERSGLWREMLRVVRDVRPRWVLAENVPALRTRGADRVLGDLESAGYACWPLVVGARHVGAPHRRDRVWIVAHKQRVADGDSGLRDVPEQAIRAGRFAAISGSAQLADSDGGRREFEWQPDHADQQGTPGHQPDGCDGARMANASAVGWLQGEQASPAGTAAWGDRASPRWPAGPGCEQYDWEPPRVVARAESGLGFGADGLPAGLGTPMRRARLKALGNSVVPQVVETIGRVVMRADQLMEMQ
jgi:DNA (cytosine-5)-methyltransferase 1